jgi:hypothetical protein
MSADPEKNIREGEFFRKSISAMIVNTGMV